MASETQGGGPAGVSKWEGTHSRQTDRQAGGHAARQAGQVGEPILTSGRGESGRTGGLAGRCRASMLMCQRSLPDQMASGTKLAAARPAGECVGRRANGNAQQAGKQASMQAGSQTGKHAGRQARHACLPRAGCHWFRTIPDLPFCYCEHFAIVAMFDA